MFTDEYPQNSEHPSSIAWFIMQSRAYKPTPLVLHIVHYYVGYSRIIQEIHHRSGTNADLAGSLDKKLSENRSHLLALTSYSAAYFLKVVYAAAELVVLRGAYCDMSMSPADEVDS